MSKVHYISPKALTYEIVENLVNEKFKLELSKEAIALIEKCRDYLDKKMAEDHNRIWLIMQPQHI